MGGGIGGLSVPRGGEGPSGSRERGVLFDAVGGINVRLFWRMGIFVEGKYVYAAKTADQFGTVSPLRCWRGAEILPPHHHLLRFVSLLSLSGSVVTVTGNGPGTSRRST
jgi:hypothetical protein